MHDQAFSCFMFPFNCLCFLSWEVILPTAVCSWAFKSKCGKKNQNRRDKDVLYLSGFTLMNDFSNWSTSLFNCWLRPNATLQIACERRRRSIHKFIKRFVNQSFAFVCHVSAFHQSFQVVFSVGNSLLLPIILTPHECTITSHPFIYFVIKSDIRLLIFWYT